MDSRPDPSTRRTPPRDYEAPPKGEREARLATALRANLRRRKAAARDGEAS